VWLTSSWGRLPKLYFSNADPPSIVTGATSNPGYGGYKIHVKPTLADISDAAVTSLNISFGRSITSVTEGNASVKIPVMHFMDQTSGATHTWESRFSNTTTASNAVFLSLNNSVGGKTSDCLWVNASGNVGALASIYAGGSVNGVTANFSGALTAVGVTSKTSADPLSAERVGLQVADTSGTVIFKTMHKSHGATDSGNFVRFYCRNAVGTLVNACNITGSAGLHVYGTITTSAGFSSTSDQSVKAEILTQDLSPLFDAVDAKTYVRTDKPELGRRCGFISQDVQSACASTGLPDTFTHEIPQDEDAILGLDYGRLVAVLWSKCKQLETRLRTIELAIESAT
jgi:hypothetical protein